MLRKIKNTERKGYYVNSALIGSFLQHTLRFSNRGPGYDLMLEFSIFRYFPAQNPL